MRSLARIIDACASPGASVCVQLAEFIRARAENFVSLASAFTRSNEYPVLKPNSVDSNSRRGFFQARRSGISRMSFPIVSRSYDSEVEMRVILVANVETLSECTQRQWHTDHAVLF